MMKALRLQTAMSTLDASCLVVYSAGLVSESVARLSSLRLAFVRPPSFDATNHPIHIWDPAATFVHRK